MTNDFATRCSESQKDINLTNTSVVAHVQEFLWHSIIICHVDRPKNDYNGVMRGSCLSRGDKGHRTPENCSYPKQNAKS